MTREEELDWLCRLRSKINVYMPKEWQIHMNNALDMAIKSLEQKSDAFWCEGCKEHDEEHHCCHRYSNFIRKSLNDNINAVLEDVKEDMKELFVDLQDGSEEWRSYVNDTVLETLEIIDKYIIEED